MGKLIYVEKDKVISANKEMEKLLNKETNWKKEKIRLNKEAKAEKDRRDEEYAHGGKQERSVK